MQHIPLEEGVDVLSLQPDDEVLDVVLVKGNCFDRHEDIISFPE
jgi:hypothetical protein